MTSETSTLEALSHDEDWVTAYFQTADRCDADDTAEWFAETIDMRFANNLPAGSKAEAREGLSHFMASLSVMLHELHARVAQGEGVVQLATVHYSLIDGREVSLPVATYLRRNAAKLIDRLWIYIDVAPIFQPV